MDQGSEAGLDLSMKQVCVKVSSVVGSLALYGVMALGTLNCSHAEVEAVNKAAEADKVAKSNPGEAASLYEQATKMDPNNHVIFYKLGRTYERTEAWDKMAAAMGRAATLQPKFANYWYYRGFALKRQAETSKGDASWDAAKEPLEKCIAADPNYDDCYFDLGDVLLQLDDEQGALENYTKAIQHNPPQLIYYPSLATLYLNLSAVNPPLADLADQVLKAGIGFEKPDVPGAAMLHVVMAGVDQFKGDNNGMISELEKAQTLDKEGAHPEIYFNLGSTYAVMDESKKQKALSLLKAFFKVACKGSREVTYHAQCKQSVVLIQKLGGSVQ